MTKQRVRLLPEPVYRRIYSKIPRLTVDILLKKDGGLVLVKRDIPPRKGFWTLPGGTVMLGETLAKAVARVSMDEAGLKVNVRKRLGVIEYSRRSAFGQTVAIVYATEAVSGDLRGNKYGRKVKVFHELPRRVIPEQGKFLSHSPPWSA